MKLIGNLKKQVEQTESKEEAKKVIENAGMLLTDAELDMVSGGDGVFLNHYPRPGETPVVGPVSFPQINKEEVSS